MNVTRGVPFGCVSIVELGHNQGKTGLLVNLLMEKLRLLVRLGCCNRIPQTGRLIKNRHLFLMVMEPGKSKEDLVSPEDLTSKLLQAHLLAVSSHGRESELSLSEVLFKMAPIPFMKSPL